MNQDHIFRTDGVYEFDTIILKKKRRDFNPYSALFYQFLLLRVVSSLRCFWKTFAFSLLLALRVLYDSGLIFLSLFIVLKGTSILTATSFLLFQKYLQCSPQISSCMYRVHPCDGWLRMIDFAMKTKLIKGTSMPQESYNWNWILVKEIWFRCFCKAQISSGTGGWAL